MIDCNSSSKPTTSNKQMSWTVLVARYQCINASSSNEFIFTMCQKVYLRIYLPICLYGRVDRCIDAWVDLSIDVLNYLAKMAGSIYPPMCLIACVDLSTCLPIYLAKMGGSIYLPTCLSCQDVWIYLLTYLSALPKWVGLSIYLSV